MVFGCCIIRHLGCFPPCSGTCSGTWLYFRGGSRHADSGDRSAPQCCDVIKGLSGERMREGFTAGGSAPPPRTSNSPVSRKKLFIFGVTATICDAERASRTWALYSASSLLSLSLPLSLFLFFSHYFFVLFWCDIKNKFCAFLFSLLNNTYFKLHVVFLFHFLPLL